MTARSSTLHSARLRSNPRAWHSVTLLPHELSFRAFTLNGDAVNEYILASWREGTRRNFLNPIHREFLNSQSQLAKIYSSNPHAKRSERQPQRVIPVTGLKLSEQEMVIGEKKKTAILEFNSERSRMSITAPA